MAVTATATDLRWYLGFEVYRNDSDPTAKETTLTGDDYREGTPGGQRLEELLAVVKDAIESWAPDSAAADAADLERLGRAQNEACYRLFGYLADFRAGGRSSLVGWTLGIDVDGGNSGRPIGPTVMVSSGAAQILQRWHPIEVEAIE